MYCAKAFFNQTYLWCGFITSNLEIILSSTSLYSLPSISNGAPSNERSHASITLTPGRSPLNKASVASHLLPLTSEPINLSLSSNTTKASWTLSWESPKVSSSNYEKYASVTTLKLMNSLHGKRNTSHWIHTGHLRLLHQPIEQRLWVQLGLPTECRSLRQTPPRQRIIWLEMSRPATEDCRGQVF